MRYMEIECDTEIYIDRKHTCCFTGHRPKFFPWGNNLGDPRAKALIRRLRAEIEAAIESGYDTFLCGGAEGVDTYAANAVATLKTAYPNIKLMIVQPYKGHNKDVTEWNYVHSLKCADRIITLENGSGAEAFDARNKYMVDNSGMLIAVYDERKGLRSGTYRTFRYAQECGLDVRQIKWMDFC